MDDMEEDELSSLPPHLRKILASKDGKKIDGNIDDGKVQAVITAQLDQKWAIVKSAVGLLGVENYAILKKSFADCARGDSAELIKLCDKDFKMDLGDGDVISGVLVSKVLGMLLDTSLDEAAFRHVSDAVEDGRTP